MTYPHTGRIGDYAHSVSLITSLFVRLGLAPSPAASVAGAFLPLSARCCHCVERPSRADGGCYPEGCTHDSIAPSAAKRCSDGRKVPTAARTSAFGAMPALDLHRGAV